MRHKRGHISIIFGIGQWISLAFSIFIDGSKHVPFGVLNQNTRVHPDDVGLFLSELRFEPQVRKSQVEGILDLVDLRGAE